MYPNNQSGTLEKKVLIKEVVVVSLLVGTLDIVAAIIHFLIRGGEQI